MATEEEREYLADCPRGTLTATVLPRAARVVAIGDLHGDLQMTRRLLRMAGIIGRRGRWIADPPDTRVVILGDLIDSWRPGRPTTGDWTDDLGVWRFLTALHRRARTQGGAVYLLLGNHEIMNAQADFRYVSPKNAEGWAWGNHRGLEGRADAYRPGGRMARQLACQSQAVLVIGSTLFAHAGVLPESSRELGLDGHQALRELNRRVRQWLIGATPALELEVTERVINHPEVSPFWPRLYGQIPTQQPLESDQCQVVREALQVYQIGQMVVGHTPQIQNGRSWINGTCYNWDDEQDRLYRVDGGLSEAFSHLIQDNHHLQYLEILDDSQFRIVRG